MKKILIFLCLSVVILTATRAQRIYIENNTFKINGQPLYLNGANTPWDNWNDLGRDFDYDWWNNHFAELNEAGINSTRVWLSCDSNHEAMLMDDNGQLKGITDGFWEDLDSLMTIAKRHKVYIMGALISFDHFKMAHETSGKWAKMLKNTANIDTFAENYAVPLVERYADNPYFFSIDVCNEIIWISDEENDSENAVSWENIQYFIGKVAQRVHETSDVLVCASNYIKYTSTKYSGNKYSDRNLSNRVDDSDAYLDFYKIHYYTWVSRWFSGFHPTQTPKYFELDDKPCITGEMPANEIMAYNRDQGKDTWLMSIKDAYEISYKNGWQGIMPWTSNGVDNYGNLENNLAEATVAFKERHYDLVYPDTSSTYLSLNTNNIELSDNITSASFNIYSNTSWSVSSNEEWIGLSISEGDGDSTIVVEALSDGFTGSRTTEIQVVSSLGTKKITLQQDITTGISQLKEDYIEIYPNPIKNDLLIINTNYQKQPLKIKIYSSEGKLVYDSISENVKSITVKLESQIKNGIYLLRLQHKNENPVAKKIIISR